jgi:hypothetical protein
MAASHDLRHSLILHAASRAARRPLRWGREGQRYNVRSWSKNEDMHEAYIATYNLEHDIRDT